MYGPLGVPAVLGLIEGSLEVLHGRTDVGEAAEHVASIAEGRVLRQPIEREVHLGRRALVAEATEVLDQIVRQLSWVDELRERAPRIRRGNDHLGRQLRPVDQRDSGGPAVRCDHRLDICVQHDLRTEGLGCVRQNLGEAPVASLVKGPLAKHSVVLAHVVKQKDQARSLRHGADLGSDNSRR